ncbi:hypothetical protein [Metabacillus litoralis]|uniref:hypothetical protein n=1 Tax=Metabacillus litoralis TaxID=152268 RepID=UPI001CFF06D4|nr:hypothetical protein [Metabacillus litoralis]
MARKFLKDDIKWAIFLSGHFLFALTILCTFFVWLVQRQAGMVTAVAIGTGLYFFVDFFSTIQESNEKDNPDKEIERMGYIAFGVALLSVIFLPYVLSKEKVEVNLNDTITFAVFFLTALSNALKDAIPKIKQIKKQQIKEDKG